jgi:hypothetical protein
MKASSIFLFAALLLVTACEKDKDDPLTPVPTPAVCGLDGFRLQATFDGNGFCPNASLFAAEGAGAITISGIDQQGRSLTLELDSLTVGTHAMNEATNTLLYTTQLALAYLTNNTTPGTLVITSHDVPARRIKGNFSASLVNELSPTPKSISGDFDVVYVE